MGKLVLLLCTKLVISSLEELGIISDLLSVSVLPVCVPVSGGLHSLSNSLIIEGNFESFEKGLMGL